MTEKDRNGFFKGPSVTWDVEYYHRMALLNGVGWVVNKIVSMGTLKRSYVEDTLRKLLRQYIENVTNKDAKHTRTSRKT